MNHSRGALLGHLHSSVWAVSLAASLTIGASWIAEVAQASVTADVLMVIAAVVSGSGIALAAVRALKARMIGIDLLVTIAMIGALMLGNYWEAAAVTTLFTIGHALERVTMTRTRSALAELVESAPDTAVVLRDGTELEIPAGQVEVGETVIIKQGSVVPVDGTVVSGVGSVNEAGITGESVPAEKSVDDEVFAGSVLASGHLRVVAEGIGAQTTLARIIRRVEDAQDARARTQTFLERFARWYTPAIVVLAVVGGLVTGDVELALTLLVIGCPGALVISVPGAVVAGVGRGAREGILIKGGEHLERAARIDVVAVDKTGTLTVGRPELTDVIPLGEWDSDAVLHWAGLAEQGSEHPLAQPIVAAARAQGLNVGPTEVEYEPAVGRGIVARSGHHVITVGTPELLTSTFGQMDLTEVHRLLENLGSQGRTGMTVGRDRQVIGIVAVADTVRPEAVDALAELRAAGVDRIIMLTGDREAVARSIADQVGVDEFRAGLLPQDKLQVISALQAQGHRVAMIGDGVNDAPALASADTGIAMGANGSALAVEAADIALMSSRLDRAASALRLARSTVSVMHQNIVIALVTVGLLLAGVFLGGVTMSIGMLVHEASVLVVIVNAMRLSGHQHPQPDIDMTQTSTRLLVGV